jgi:hypothetical protein
LILLIKHGVVGERDGNVGNIGVRFLKNKWFGAVAVKTVSLSISANDLQSSMSLFINFFTYNERI